jgi:putative endonuclease
VIADHPGLRRPPRGRCHRNRSDDFGRSSWQVYILRCADDTLYTGITNRLPARLKTHNGTRGAKYARTRRPVVLAWSTPSKSRGAALSLEHTIKQLTRSQKQTLIAVAGGARKQMLRRLRAGAARASRKSRPR